MKINGIYIKTIGHGSPILTIHGGPGLNSTYFSPYLDPLSKNFKLIYYDQRGCGKSGMKKNYNADYKDYLNDIDMLVNKFTNNRITILAHSFGTVLAIKYFLKNPDKVHNLILVSGYSRKHPDQYRYYTLSKTTQEKIKKVYESKMTEQQKQKKVNLLKTLAYFHKPEFKNLSFVKKLFSAMPVNKNIFKNLVYNSEYQDFDARKRLEKTGKVKTLIIVGKHDIITPPFLSKELEKHIHDAKLVVFKQSGHFPFIEENAKFIKTVSQFLLRR